jgi:leader peptidase (prepilin peptidase)/N-methyltransferase
MIMSVPLLLFLLTGSVLEIRKKTVPILLLAVSGAAGVLIRLICWKTGGYNIMEMFMGILLGAVFIGISLISDGKIGMGDALAILTTGIYLGGRAATLSVLDAMIAASFVSIIILFLRKGTRNTALPFLPFLFLGCLIETTGAII